MNVSGSLYKTHYKLVNKLIFQTGSTVEHRPLRYALRVYASPKSKIKSFILSKLLLLDVCCFYITLVASCVRTDNPLPEKRLRRYLLYFDEI